MKLFKYIGTFIDLMLNYKKVGSDQYGNIYFLGKKPDSTTGKPRRKIWYNGEVEASKIPPVWHSWLNYMIDSISEEDITTHHWQKDFTPNLTGFKSAVKGQLRNEQNVKYIAWEPK
jgi:NADH:ubiquinone oxidoreductase subunit